MSEKRNGRKRYNFYNDFDYMASPIWQHFVLEILGRLEESNGRQEELNQTYMKLS